MPVGNTLLEFTKKVIEHSWAICKRILNTKASL